MNKAVLLIIVLLVLTGTVLGWSKIREKIVPTPKETPITFITPVPQITQTVFPTIKPTPIPTTATSSTTKGGLKTTPITGVNLLIPSLASFSLGLAGWYLVKKKA